jgi:hypothetical protein
MDFALGILVLLGVIGGFFGVPFLLIKKKKLEKHITSLTDQAQNLTKQVNDLEEEIEPLRQYQNIVNAKAEEERILHEAQQAADAMEEQARKILAEAEEGAGQSLSEARAKAKELRDRAQEHLNRAAEEATRIVAVAKSEAEQIAGDAYEAKGKAELYEKTVRAMKNIINGYGDEYLVPSLSVLDGLAEDFEHKEAGQELKKARSYTKSMIRNDLAATCEYVDQSKRTTAIRFVVDAFNGKTDSALSRVRYDNLGKLRQEIEDSFNLVNKTGEAFRNAKITPAYLQARLDELRWAVATNELKRQEQEEQRRIKEAIREEEKARREYELAIKKAEKEEKDLQAAMNLAQQQLSEATEEQRQMYEQKLEELQEKLAEAEARNERALSMAQQTKRGHVYVISNVGSFGEDVVKIGMTRRLEPTDRVRELGDASVPFPFDIHAMLYSEDAPDLETKLHRTFQDAQVNRVNARKEFFHAGIKNIRQTVEEMGLEAHWTMLAEAKEYRETLAIKAAAEVAT